jgi:hypothetical protein
MGAIFESTRVGCPTLEPDAMEQEMDSCYELTPCHGAGAYVFYTFVWITNLDQFTSFTLHYLLCSI